MHGVGDPRPSHTQIRMVKERDGSKGRREVEQRPRQRRRTVTNRGLILGDGGLPHLVISHTCSEMGSHHP